MAAHSASRTHTTTLGQLEKNKTKLNEERWREKKSINEFDIEGNSWKQTCNQLINCIFYSSGPMSVCALVLDARIIYVQIDWETGNNLCVLDGDINDAKRIFIVYCTVQAWVFYRRR